MIKRENGGLWREKKEIWKIECKMVRKMAGENKRKRGKRYTKEQRERKMKHINKQNKKENDSWD